MCSKYPSGDEPEDFFRKNQDSILKPNKSFEYMVSSSKQSQIIFSRIFQ